MTEPATRTTGPLKHRSGVTLVELVVSVVVLTTVMTLSTSLYFRTQHVWNDIRQQRLAINELSNQLEWLTQLSPEETRQALTSLKPSEVCLSSLKQARLSGELTDDELGTRLVLQINWRRRFQCKPVELSGWLHDFDERPTPASLPPHVSPTEKAEVEQ